MLVRLQRTGCGADYQVGIKPDLACHAIDAPPLQEQSRASLEQLPPGEKCSDQNQLVAMSKQKHAVLTLTSVM